MERSSQDIELESLGPTRPAQHQPDPERAGSRTDGTDTNEATLEEFELSILERAVDFVWDIFSSSGQNGQVPHPDHGWRPWCIILSCHLIFMNTCGWANSFGIFQMYYSENMSLPAGKISWIGSIGACLLFFVGALTSCLVYANTVRWIFSIGIILQFFGLILTSVCRKYWQYLLAQGVLIGLGHGLIFCPALAVLSTHFATRRPAEIGFAFCGSAVGGTLFPGIVRFLTPKLSYEWMLVVVNSVKLATLILALLLVKPKVKPDQSHPIIRVAMLKDIGYILFVIACFCATMGIYIAYYFLALYSRTTVDIPFSSEESLILLAIFNSVGIASYFIMCTAGHTYGPINVSALAMLTGSILLYFWIAVHNSAGLYVWSAFYGIAAAAVQSLLYMSIPSLTEEQDKRVARVSVAFMIASLAALTGPPIADKIIELQGGYMGARVFARSVTLLGSASLAAAKMMWMNRTKARWLGKI